MIGHWVRGAREAGDVWRLGRPTERRSTDGHRMTRILLLAALMLAVPVAAQGPELFVVSDAPAGRVGLSDESHVLRSRWARLDRDRLLDSVADGSPLVLNLFPDARFEARVEQTRAASPGSVFVYATLRDGGHATLFLHGEIVRGEVHSPSGVYTVRSTGRSGAGSVRIEQLDVSALPPIDHATRRDRLNGESWGDWSAQSGMAPSASLADEEGEDEDAGPDETVDLLVVYTRAAEEHEGGRAETEATIIAELENANQALANSGLSHRQIRLVAMERVEHMLTEFGAINALDPKGYSVGDPEGILDEVFELRQRYGADMMHIFLGSSYVSELKGCGAGGLYQLKTHRRVEEICANEREYVDVELEGCVPTVRKENWKSYGSVSDSAINCTGRYVFTHEFGHNLGIFHDRYVNPRLSFDDPVWFPYRPYGFGYVNQNFSRSECYRTVMAYNDQCVDEGYSFVVQALMFSNPDLKLGSEEEGFDPAGVPGEETTVEPDGPVNASRGIDEVWDIVANLYSKTESGHAVPFMPAAGDDRRQGFVRVVNHAPEAGEIMIEAFDDIGTAYDPVALAIGANQTLHFNSDDLEMGNAAKGLSGGVGAGEGDWRLKLTSLLEIEVLAYVRTSDGFLTAMHDLMPASGPGRRAPFFNPGSNENQVSMLRLVNDYVEEAEVVITAVDDDGVEGDKVRVLIPPHAARTFTAKELEEGSDSFEGAFGDGVGKWRVFVESEWDWHAYWNPPEALMRVMAMSLLESPTGHLTNLSSIPRNESLGAHSVPLFPAKSAAGRQGFARVVNRSGEAGEAMIVAHDDAGREYGPVTLALAANGAAHFNSDDLEDGNAAKGLSGGIGPGEGDWRLELTSDLKIDVLAYVRTDDGFVTTMHDAAPSLIHRHRAPTFNPGSNADQVSSLRLVNPGEDDAEVTIAGIDGDGVSPGSDIRITVPARASRTLTSQELESGGTGFDGSLGDGAGKWELEIRADREIVAMSLLESPTGHLTNLSTAPVRGAGPWPPAETEVSER